MAILDGALPETILFLFLLCTLCLLSHVRIDRFPLSRTTLRISHANKRIERFSLFSNL